MATTSERKVDLPVLMLGSSYHLRRACELRGLNFVTCARNSDITNSSGGALAGESTVTVPSFDSAEIVLSALERSRIPLNAFSSVLSAKEAGVVLAASLAAALQVTGLNLKTAVASRDKSLQKQLVSQWDVPCADIWHVATIADLARSTIALPGAAVLKPLQGVASGRTRVVDSSKSLRGVAADFLSEGVHPDTSFILEQKLDFEQEWHLDGVMKDGRLDFISVGRYLAPPLASSGIAVASQILDPVRHRVECEMAEKFAQRCVKGLGITAGVFHLEVFRTGQRLVFGECAVRPGGGAIVDAVEVKHGVNLADRILDSVCGLNVADPGKGSEADVATLFLPGLPGVVREAPAAADLLAQPSVSRGSIDAVPGARLGDSRVENRPFGGWAVVTATDEEALLRELDRLVRWYAERTIVTHDGREENLLAYGAAAGCAFAGAS